MNIAPRRRAKIVIGAVVAVNTTTWLASPPASDGRDEFVRQVLAEYLASTAVLLFSLALILASRVRLLEAVFGGLDRIYAVHRHVAQTGFVLLLAHVALIPWRLEFKGGGPLAGVIAFAGIATLVVVAAGPRVPCLRPRITITYQRWRRTHRYVGVYFIISLAHSLLTNTVIKSAPLAFILMLAGYVSGIAAYLYSLSLARFLRPQRLYSVWGVRNLNSCIAVVTLRPVGRRQVEYRSGQFAFASFQQYGLHEPHPFTISSAPGEPTLTLTIKASGDFTKRLARDLQIGTYAVVEGGYGTFDYRDGSPRQVWIAGGIGITPFLSWLRDKPSTRTTAVDLFYVVRYRHDAVCWEVLRALQQHHPKIRIHLHVSTESGSFTAERILENIGDYSKRDYFLCGPAGLIQSLQRQLRTRGVADKAIHHEEFSFR